MQNIEWKSIKDYEDLYMVSNTGLVKRTRFINGKHNFTQERLLKPIINKDGYAFVRLCKNGKVSNKRIHKLVANAFLGESNLQVDHLDGNKLNNNVENLEWVTPKENTNRAWKKGQAKYTKERKEKLSKIAKEKWNNNTFRKWRAKQFESMEYKI